LTARNAAMFGPPGTVYVYICYGIHVLLNLVCDLEGVGSAVLLRSFEPLGDTRVLVHNRAGARKRADGRGESGGAVTLPELSCGPGRVGQALGLHLGLNGLPLGDMSGLFIIDDRWRPEVACSTRIGISQGDRLPLRYYAVGSAYVSGSRRTSRGEGT
jgi:DNA-3-methyladenine glycosylase